MQMTELMREVKDLEAVLFITKDGKLLDYDITQKFLKEHDFKSTHYLTDLVSLRFRISNFATLFGGLEMTVNRFKNKIMVSKSLANQHIMIMILPLSTNLEELNQILKHY